MSTLLTRLRPRLLTRLSTRRVRCVSSEVQAGDQAGDQAEDPASDPLRILFCGSDAFSCAALEALDKERRAGGVVESLDVMVRPGKRTGRGLKKIKEVPLKKVASDLDLPIHECDTFRGFELPTPVNLVIAVSFGLFVPWRILKETKYGGLNVHPSYLPDLRGAAPLHHVLLQDRTHTGITLQTLDTERFDHGRILAQTARPGIPIPPGCTVPQLTELVKAPAAELLLDSLRRGLHVAREEVKPDEPVEASKARRLTKKDQRLDLGASAGEMAKRLRILGPLWFEALARDEEGMELGRVILRDAEAVEVPEGGEWREVEVLEVGTRPVKVRYLGVEDGAVVVALPGGGGLRVREIVVGGMRPRPAVGALAPFTVAA